MIRLPLSRRHWQRQMAALDPESDYLDIYRLHVLHEFPWDTEQALQLAFFRTFAVPSIGDLLAATGEFTDRTQRRYDDTALILAEILVSGPDSERGRTALRRMNGMHRHHGVNDEDMAYVLATLAVSPKRWLDQFGYRPMSPVEVVAVTRYFQDMGRRVGLRDLPSDFDGFERLLDDYEARYFPAAGTFWSSPNATARRRVADATFDLLASWWPRPLRPLVRAVSVGLLDERLRQALGYEDRPVARRVAVACLTARARLLRLAPARRRARRPQHSRTLRSYPHGDEVGALGTLPAATSRPSPSRHPTAT
ncbi:MAG: oxygenase MpaB family protein [Actinomycetales bacterium]